MEAVPRSRAAAIRRAAPVPACAWSCARHRTASCPAGRGRARPVRRRQGSRSPACWRAWLSSIPARRPLRAMEPRCTVGTRPAGGREDAVIACSKADRRFRGAENVQQKKPALGRLFLERGGAREDRTPDLVIANDALSQLSYGPGREGDYTEA